MYTYTLLELESKTFGELKKIGYELNVLPEGDRRRRENWINAIAGVTPPLLALLEVSPAVEVQAQEPIIETVASSGVEVDTALNHKFLLCLKEGHNTLWYDGKNFVPEKWSAKTYCKRGVGSAKHQLRFHPEVRRLGNLQVVENSSADQKAIEVQAQEPIIETVEPSPYVEVEPAQEAPLESKFGRIVYPRPIQEAIEPAVENSSGVEVEPVQKAIAE